MALRKGFFPILFGQSSSNVGKPVFTTLEDSVNDAGQLEIPLDCVTSVIGIDEMHSIVGIRNRHDNGFKRYLSFSGHTVATDNVDGSDPTPLIALGSGSFDAETQMKRLKQGPSQARVIAEHLRLRESRPEFANEIVSADDATTKGTPVSLIVNQRQAISPNDRYGFREKSFEDVTEFLAFVQEAGTRPMGTWIRADYHNDQIRALIDPRELRSSTVQRGFGYGLSEPSQGR